MYTMNNVYLQIGIPNGDMDEEGLSRGDDMIFRFSNTLSLYLRAICPHVLPQPLDNFVIMAYHIDRKRSTLAHEERRVFQMKG